MRKGTCSNNNVRDSGTLADNNMGKKDGDDEDKGRDGHGGLWHWFEDSVALSQAYHGK